MKHFQSFESADNFAHLKTVASSRACWLQREAITVKLTQTTNQFQAFNCE